MAKNDNQNNKNRNNEIAIIGVACRLPAGLDNRQSLWQFLIDRKDAVVEVPSERWSLRRFYDPIDTTPGRTSMRYGSFLHKEAYDFEPLFFGISPREGITMDFQQRLLLTVTWHVLEDAGLIAADLLGSRTSVFIGGFTQDHLLYCGSPFMRVQIRDQFAATAAPMTMLAARLAHVFGFQGPTMTLDTACSSSLVALHQACNSLRLHECDMALAGGVNFMFLPQPAMIMTKGHFLAKDGRSKSFDASADGYGRGEGCVVFALKRLEDALRDGNEIRGVISASGVNQDGRTPVLTMPDADAQENLIRDVAQRAGIPAGFISYVEAHGTGTPVGDPIEARAIGRSVGQGCLEEQPEGEKVVVGAVKANLGHTEAAAGALGVLKAMLCLEKRCVPPQANLITPNPAIPFGEYHLEVPQEEPVSLAGREARDGHLYALVNSFGYGGTNAVAILRRPTEEEQQSALNSLSRTRSAIQAQTDGKPQGFLGQVPLLLTVFSESAFSGLAKAYKILLQKEEAPSYSDICASSVLWRTHFRHRAVILPRKEDSHTEIEEALEALEVGKTHPALFRGEAVIDKPAKPVFLCSGMGPQWWGMARYLLTEAPAEVRLFAGEIDALFSRIAGWSIIEALLEPEETSRVQETSIAQPGIFLVQLCLARFFALHGVTPGAVVGHSLGEVAAAYLAGALELEDAVRVVFHRSRLQARFEGRGGMLAVGLGEEALKERLAPYGAAIGIAAINAPDACTLAGEALALEQFAESCQKEGIFNKFLRTIVPYHSPLMDEIADEMVGSLKDIRPKTPNLPLYSTVTGAIWPMGEDISSVFHDGAYWQRNARQTVRFSDAVRALLANNHTIFLELSPHPVLGGSIRNIAGETRHAVEVCPTLRRPKADKNRAEPVSESSFGPDDATNLVRALVQLSLSGAEPDWSYILPPGRVALPYYTWHVEGDLLQETEAARRDRLDLLVHPILGTPSVQAGKRWQSDIATIAMPWLSDHRIDGVTLFPAAGYIEAALAVHREIEAKDPAILEDIRLIAPLVLQEGSVPNMVWDFDPSTRVMNFQSESLPWNGDWQTHGQVTILHSAPWARGRADLEQLTANCKRFEGKEVYEVLAGNGLDYGPAFRTLRALYRRKGRGAVGHIVLAEAETQTVADYLLHPALLDGAMHAMIGAFPLEEMAKEEGGVFVPVGIRRLSYLGQKCTELFVEVTPTLQTGRKVEADLRLYTPEGDVLAEIEGLCCRRLARAGHDAASHLRRLLYAPGWLGTERQVLLNEPHKLAFIGPEDADIQALKTVLAEAGALIESYQPSSKETAEADQLKALFSNDMALADLRALVITCPAWSFIRSPAEDGTVSGVSVVQDILGIINALEARTRKQRIPVIVLTRNAFMTKGQEDPVCPAQRAVIGFCRAVQSERMDLHLRCVDLPAILPEDMLEDIAAELLLAESPDDTVALRPEQRLVQRLLTPDLAPEPDALDFKYLQDNVPDGTQLGVRLTPGTSHTLEGLHWQAYPVPQPGAGEVALRTLIASLNFKDTLKAMNLLPESVIEGTYNGDQLGMEAVVEVAAIGEGVTEYHPGQRLVVVHPDSFASWRVLPVKNLEYVTRALTPEIEAFGLEKLAGAPLVFVTAYHCLIALANVQKGETVLIHAGAGGVGLAAIQIALMQGAVVYATAGSKEKRDYLLEKGCTAVWDSRSLEFVEGIREATGGRGVDVVLNSLSGEALTHSLGLVASRGRFVEIGKRDIIEHQLLDLTPFNENIAFFSVDMDRLMPFDWIEGTFDKVFGLAQEHKLEFLPCTSFRADEANEAFRFLAGSKHIGKVVLDFRDLDDVQARPPKKPLPVPRQDSSYLITGGFGGLGLKLAEFLLQQGAGKLHLLGRRLPETLEKQEALAQICALAERLGAEIETHHVDVTDRPGFRAIIEAIRQGERPLRGVFHTAGILEDAVLPHMTGERIARVMAPKVIGAEILDEATEGLALDYFVLFSSFTTEIGNIGQSAYLAANAWLDGLAERRRQRGLAGLSVGWGAIGDVGMLSGNETAERMFEAAGVKTLAAEKALSLLPDLMKTNLPVVSVVDIDWSTAFAALGLLADQTRFSMVRQEARQGGLSSTLQALFEIPETERLAYVLMRLKRQLGSVLQIDPETISDNARLSELGIDSLAGVELQMAIRVEFGVDVSLVFLARNETIIEMSRSLLRQAINMQAGQIAMPEAQAEMTSAHV